MEAIYIFDAIFQAKRDVRSLPPFHGARWSAWLRFACAPLAFSLPDIVLGILPLRNGQNPISAGEVLGLRMLVPQKGVGQLHVLARALRQVENRGQFSAHTLDLLLWRDVTGGVGFAPEEPVNPAQAVPLTMECLRPEISLLSSLATFTINFHVPLRLKLPAGSSHASGEIARYCPENFFVSGNSLAWLLKKIRFLPDCEADICFTPRIASHNLTWHDMRYNESRRIALGGVLGKICLQGAPNRQAAQRLVMGQYMGAGKNPLFGLGYWLIEELLGHHK